MSVWKMNAVVVAIVLFVGAAVYLNWSYGRETTAGADSQGGGKLLGQAALVNGKDDKQTGDGKTAGDAQSSAQPSADPSASPSAAGESTGYFASARLNRQQARDSALAILQESLSDENLNDTMKDENNQAIQTLANVTVSEAQIENLVTAKGYGDCVCFINENSASVVVSSTADGLNETDIAKIAEIVMEETGLTPTKVTIIEAEP